MYIYVYVYIYIYNYIYIWYPPQKKNYLFTIFTGIYGVFRLNFCDSNKECSNMSEACKPASATC